MHSFSQENWENGTNLHKTHPFDEHARILYKLDENACIFLHFHENARIFMKQVF